jgi:hypothetical protein
MRWAGAGVTAARDVLWQAREAISALICAGSSSCSAPDDCYRFAAEHVTEANRILGRHQVEVRVFGRLATPMRVTDGGDLLVDWHDGGSDVVHPSEVTA